MPAVMEHNQQSQVKGDDLMNSLEFAISMELEGGKYYREQAEKNQGNSLRTVFLMLAEDEDNHEIGRASCRERV